MHLGKGRFAKWFPITLAVTGSFALLIGIFVAVLSIPRVVAAGHPGSNMPLQGALYVGTNTCFTCHGDHPLDWSLPLYAQTVLDPFEKPQAVVNLKSGEQVQQMDADEIVEAYTSSDETTLRQNPSHQYYVIQTEDGHVVHPSQQNMDAMQTDDRFSKCSTCHTTNLGVKPSEDEDVGLTVFANPVSVTAAEAVLDRQSDRKYETFGASLSHRSSVEKDLF